MNRSIHLKWLAVSLLASQSFAQSEYHELDKIEVQARDSQSILGDTALRTMVISREEIQNNHAKTLEDALRFTPGINIKPIGNNSESGSGISIQGLDPSQVLILVDGNPVPPNSGEMLDVVDISQVLVGNVESIEIVQGGASAIYGANAMGGVVNVITQNPEKPFSFSADLSAGDWGSKSDEKTISKGSAILSASGRSGNIATIINANLVNQEGYDTDPEESGTDGWHGYKNNYSAKIQHNSRNGNVLTISPSLYRAETATHKIAQDINKTPFENKVTSQRDTWDVNYQGIYQGTAFKLHSSIQKYNEKIDNNSDDLNQESKNRSYDVSFNRHFGYDHLFTLALEHHYEYLNQFNVSKQIFEVENKDKQSSDLSLSDNWIIGNGVELVPAIRVNNDDLYGSHVSPMLSARSTYHSLSGDELNIRASISDGYKTPTLKHLYWEFNHGSLIYLGNPDLNPETSLNTQIGFELLSDTSRYELNLFNNEISNLIGTRLNPNLAEELNVSAVFEYTNIKNSRTQGADLSYRKIFDLAEINIGYSYLNATNLETGKKIPEKPENQIILGVTALNFKGMRASLNYRYYDKQYIDFDNKEFVNAYGHADFKFNHKIDSNFSWYLGIDNITNKKPEEFTTEGGHSGTDNDVFSVTPRYTYIGVRFNH